MSALSWMEQINEIAVMGLVAVGLIALAVVCAPSMPARRIPALAKRMRDTARY